MARSFRAFARPPGAESVAPISPVSDPPGLGRLVFGILASLAELERELIRERVRAGLDAARSETTKCLKLGCASTTRTMTASGVEKGLPDGFAWPGAKESSDCPLEGIHFCWLLRMIAALPLPDG
ncbi:MAG TPA: recombinase family protein [Terriglobales bacterium]|nr:recombinase family protein [Terriglobales bacterium]